MTMRMKEMSASEVVRPRETALIHAARRCRRSLLTAAEKVDWVEKFVRVGTKATEAARNEHDK